MSVWHFFVPMLTETAAALSCLQEQRRRVSFRVASNPCNDVAAATGVAHPHAGRGLVLRDIGASAALLRKEAQLLIASRSVLGVLELGAQVLSSVQLKLALHILRRAGYLCQLYDLNAADVGGIQGRNRYLLLALLTQRPRRDGSNLKYSGKAAAAVLKKVGDALDSRARSQGAHSLEQQLLKEATDYGASSNRAATMVDATKHVGKMNRSELASFRKSVGTAEFIFLPTIVDKPNSSVSAKTKKRKQSCVSELDSPAQFFNPAGHYLPFIHMDSVPIPTVTTQMLRKSQFSGLHLQSLELPSWRAFAPGGSKRNRTIYPASMKPKERVSIACVPVLLPLSLGIDDTCVELINASCCLQGTRCFVGLFIAGDGQAMRKRVMPTSLCRGLANRSAFPGQRLFSKHCMMAAL